LNGDAIMIFSHPNARKHFPFFGNRGQTPILILILLYDEPGARTTDKKIGVCPRFIHLESDEA